MKTFVTLTALASLAAAQRDPWARLEKPPLVDGLGYLEAGLNANLPDHPFQASEWNNGQIPQDCFNIANEQQKSPADFRIFDVTYDDCGDPWVFCYHKDSEVTIDSMARQFGKLPIQMRQYVKHVVSIPNDGGWAYMSGGNIVFFRPVDDMVNVFVHETGHSLDLNGAYGEQLSSSDNWWNNYDQDTNVPDGYAQSNAVEDVAQNTVLAVYNENVEGGYGGIEPNYQAVFHQFATVITVANDNGDGNSIIVPGSGSQCVHRIPASSPVAASGLTSRVRRDLKDVSLKFARAIEIPANAPSTKDHGCALTW